MNLQQQKELINLYRQYQQTNKNTIKANLKAHTSRTELKPSDIAERTGIPVQTIYQMRKYSSAYKPDFITCLIICDLLQIPITEITKPITGELILPQVEPTKWDQQAKQEFITDYNRMNITEICNKYSITARTAQEYNKNFLRDITG